MTTKNASHTKTDKARAKERLTFFSSMEGKCLRDVAARFELDEMILKVI